MASKQASNKKTTKKRVSRNISAGQVHIKTSFNNTIVCFTDCEGNVLSWCSSGKLGLKGSKKSTPFAAQSCVEDAAKVAKEHGITKTALVLVGDVITHQNYKKSKLYAADFSTEFRQAKEK
mgnify:CR=1 FL=1